MVPVNVTYSQWRPGRSVCLDPTPPPPRSTVYIFSLVFLRRQLQSGYWYAASRHRRKWRGFYLSGKELSSIVKITWNLPSPRRHYYFALNLHFSHSWRDWRRPERSFTECQKMFCFCFSAFLKMFLSRFISIRDKYTSFRTSKRKQWNHVAHLKLIFVTFNYISLINFVYQAWQLNEKYSLIISCTLTRCSWL